MVVATSGASAPRDSARSISRGPRPRTARGPRGHAPQRRQVRTERPAVAAGHRAGQRRADPEGASVAQRPLDERAVDRQRPGLVEAGDAAQFHDRVEQRHEPAGRQHRGGVVGRLRAGRQADRRRRRSPRPSRPAASASWSSPSIATVAPWRAATARSVSAKATSGWNAPTWVPAAIAGARTSAPSAPLVWIIAWPLYIRSAPASGRDRIVGDGQDDQLDLVDERLRVGERAAHLDERPEPLAPAGVAAGDGVDRPARARQGDPERRPHGPRPDDPDDRWLAGPGVLVRVGVVARMDLVAVAVVAGRRRIEVDARRLDRRLRLGAVASPDRRPADRPSPSSSPGRDVGRGGRGRAPVECSEESLATGPSPSWHRPTGGYTRGQPRPGAGAPARRRLTPRICAVDEGGASWQPDP